MPRPLTSAEKSEVQNLFPNMNVERVVVSAEADVTYNCLAWTLGITSRWVWPWGSRDATKAEFDALYRSHGLSPSQNGPIAAFGASNNAMKHGAISGLGHGTRWESKLGNSLRIQHGLGEMEGGFYGRTKGFYSGSRLLRTDRTIVEALEKEDLMALLSDDEKELVLKLNSTVDVHLRKAFIEAYAKWVATWSDPGIAFSSVPGDYAKSDQFRRLLAMGEAIVPLVIEKLIEPDQFFALQLVEHLAKREIVSEFEPEDPIILEGEQERAAATVRRWLGFNA